MRDTFIYYNLSIILIIIAVYLSSLPAATVPYMHMSSSWLHYSDRRGPRSWTARALSSCSLPPPALLAFFAIVVFFLAVSGYVDYKAIERRAEIGARVFAAPLALAAAFLLFAALSWQRRYWTTRRRARAHHHHLTTVTPAPATNSPWGVALAVAVLLLMMWFRPLWDTDDY